MPPEANHHADQISPRYVETLGFLRYILANPATRIETSNILWIDRAFSSAQEILQSSPWMFDQGDIAVLSEYKDQTSTELSHINFLNKLRYIALTELIYAVNKERDADRIAMLTSVLTEATNVFAKESNPLPLEFLFDKLETQGTLSLETTALFYCATYSERQAMIDELEDPIIKPFAEKIQRSLRNHRSQYNLPDTLHELFETLQNIKMHLSEQDLPSFRTSSCINISEVIIEKIISLIIHKLYIYQAPHNSQECTILSSNVKIFDLYKDVKYTESLLEAMTDLHVSAEIPAALCTVLYDMCALSWEYVAQSHTKPKATPPKLLLFTGDANQVTDRNTQAMPYSNNREIAYSMIELQNAFVATHNQTNNSANDPVHFRDAIIDFTTTLLKFEMLPSNGNVKAASNKTITSMMNTLSRGINNFCHLINFSEIHAECPAGIIGKNMAKLYLRAIKVLACTLLNNSDVDDNTLNDTIYMLLVTAENFHGHNLKTLLNVVYMLEKEYLERLASKQVLIFNATEQVSTRPCINDWMKIKLAYYHRAVSHEEFSDTFEAFNKAAAEEAKIAQRTGQPFIRKVFQILEQDGYQADGRVATDITIWNAYFRRILSDAAKHLGILQTTSTFESVDDVMRATVGLRM